MNKHLSAIIILLLLVTTLSYGKILPKKQDDNKKEAQRIWELAIQAKGGREKLYQIQNIQTSLKGWSRFESLIVYPNKLWVWEDYSPSVLGLNIQMLNLETNKKYYIQRGQKQAELKPIERNDFAERTVCASIWVILENKWLHPMPEKLTSDTIGFRKVDVVQTRLKGQRIDFAFDRKTYLPVKVSYYLPNYNDAGEHLATETQLSDYFEYNGINVPTKLKESDGNSYKIKYQFNVEYDEDIFTAPPLPAETAFDAWKLKN